MDIEGGGGIFVCTVVVDELVGFFILIDITSEGVSDINSNKNDKIKLNVRTVTLEFMFAKVCCFPSFSNLSNFVM